MAVTCWLAFIVTTHVELVLLQELTDQPAKVELPAGVSVSVTLVPKAKLALQVGFGGQVIPPGLLVTVPVPVPARITVNVGPLKVAVTC